MISEKGNNQLDQFMCSHGYKQQNKSIFILVSPMSFCPFSFGHCVVCPSLTYGFLLPLWYRQTLPCQRNIIGMQNKERFNFVCVCLRILN